MKVTNFITAYITTCKNKLIKQTSSSQVSKKYLQTQQTHYSLELFQFKVIILNKISYFIFIQRIWSQEPRGYPCQNLNILFPSEMSGVDFGFVTCEQNEIYPLFSGHNTMCVVTALLVSSNVHYKHKPFECQIPSSWFDCKCCVCETTNN